MVKNLPQSAKKILHISHRLVRRVLLSLLGALLVIIVLGVLELNSRPDLSVWHETVLDEEFTADSGLQTFDEYLELEERLFKQLDQEIYQKIEKTGRTRYQPLLPGQSLRSGSLADQLEPQLRDAGG